MNYSTPTAIFGQRLTVGYKMASLPKWLSACLRTNWLWVRILLQSNKMHFSASASGLKLTQDFDISNLIKN